MPNALSTVAEAPTAAELVKRALSRWPDRVAFTWQGGSMHRSAVLELIGRFQSVFNSTNAGTPRRVALLSSNRVEAWCAEIAIQALGSSITWLHPMGAAPDQLEQLADSESDTLVVDASTFHDRGVQLHAQSRGLANVWTLGPASFGQDLLAAAAGVSQTTPRFTAVADDIATLNYTGGTTGKSKAAVRRQRAHAAMYRAILCDFELPAVPRYLAAAPISHVAGTKILPVLLRGGSVHLMPRFDPALFLSVVEEQRINMSLLVPTMIYALLDAPALETADLSSLELLLYGASPMSPTRLAEGINRIGPVFSQLYGQTECYPLSLLRRSDHEQEADLHASCGHPVTSCDVRVFDADWREVERGETGEICVRAPHAMEEYWQRDQMTAETIVNGWLRTGDLARVDSNGYLFIVDRTRDMVVSGGFNIYPREVEDILTSDPDVAMAAVIGVPDPRWGEAVMAVVVPRPGAHIDTDRLVLLVKNRKGAQHAPKHLIVAESLPMTALGKIDKKVLRAPYWAGRERSVA